MNKDAEQKFSEMIKGVIENTDFDKDLDNELKNLKPPSYEDLKKRQALRGIYAAKTRKLRILKIAGFVLAFFVGSGAVNILGGSELVSASRFEINNFIFSVRNGFAALDIQFDRTAMGRELFITNEEQIPIGREFLNELRIPTYIPNSYSFVSLTVTKNSKREYSAVFIYKNNSNEIIMINQESLTNFDRVLGMDNIEDNFYMDNAHVFYMRGIITEYNSIFAVAERETFYITGSLELESLIKIFEMME